MSTITLTYPNIRRDQPTRDIGPITLLVITSLVLIATAILVMVIEPNQDANQGDLILVAQSSPVVSAVAVPVPTPPTVDVQPIASGTPAPPTAEIGQSVVTVPVPTP